MTPRATAQDSASALRNALPTAALVGLLAVATLCLTGRFGHHLGPTDAVYARAEPTPVAAMRRLFPQTNPALDAAASEATGKPENLELAVSYFRGWMRERATDVLHAPDQPLLAVAAARLHVLLAARAEDPRLCVQYARAPAGGVAHPVSAPSPLLAQAVDDELVQEVAAARTGADTPVDRPSDVKHWTSLAARHRASWPVQEVIRGSSRLARLSTSRQCAAYIETYRLALSLPAADGAGLAAEVLAHSLAAPDASARDKRT